MAPPWQLEGASPAAGQPALAGPHCREGARQRRNEAELAVATEKLQAFQSFCDLAREHMITLVMEVAKARAGVASELVSRTRIVVATMDAYCKYKAGRLQGAARGVLDKLRTKLALVDESEAYALDQAVAGLGGIGAFETVVALGETRAKPRMLLRSTNFSLDRTYAHSPLYGISECSDDESYTDVDELYTGTPRSAATGRPAAAPAKEAPRIKKMRKKYASSSSSEEVVFLDEEYSSKSE